VLGYAYNGAGYLRRMLSSHEALACVSGTGLLPLCEMAASAWQQIENRGGPPSSLAIASIRMMTDSLITTALAGTGKTRWCEIAFAPPRYAEIFMQMYPAAKFVCLHRNCLDVVSSGIRANPWGLADTPMKTFTGTYPGNLVAAVAAYWAASTEPLLEFEQAHPGACHRLKYEDLVSRPDETFSQMSSFLSLDVYGPGNRHLAGDDLIPTSGGNGLLQMEQVPVGWIPRPLITLVNQLMEQLGYPPVPMPDSGVSAPIG